MAGVESLLARPDVARLADMLQKQPSHTVEEPGVRRAAVALVLRVGRADLELLFVERAVYEGDPWSGQVAFPGGREEPSDGSLAETAMRETREETGIDLERTGRVIGALDDLRPRAVRLPAIVVRPFVVIADCDDRCALAAEIADAFWIPLAVLRDSRTRRETTVSVGGAALRVNAYHHGGHVIWGMTERILTDFLHRYEGAPARRAAGEGR